MNAFVPDHCLRFYFYYSNCFFSILIHLKQVSWYGLFFVVDLLLNLHGNWYGIFVIFFLVLIYLLKTV